MRSVSWMTAGAVVLGLVLGLGCEPKEKRRTTVVHEQPVVVEEVRPAEPIIVQEAPPPIRVERIPPPPPGTEVVWVQGYWGWDHGRYVWFGGHYARVPYHGARWIPDRWEQRGHEHHYTPGHWDRDEHGHEHH